MDPQTMGLSEGIDIKLEVKWLKHVFSAKLASNPYAFLTLLTPVPEYES